MSEADKLLADLQARRRFWVELGDGLAVQMQRPGETRFAELRTLTAERLASYAVAWRGFTTARLLGPAIGSDAEVPFSTAVWVELLADSAEWSAACAEQLLKVVNDHMAQREATAKN